MAESFVNVTEGSGKKLHTWQRTIGANNVEDEYVLQGEPALASYVAIGPAGTPSSTGTANSHLLQIMAGSSLKVRIRRIEVYQAGLATTAALCTLVIQRLSTAGTGGSAGSSAPLDTTDAAAGLSTMALPTAKGTEASLVAHAVVYLMQTVGASSQLSEPCLVLDFDTPRSKPLVIPAGTANGIAIKNLTAVAGATVYINVYADESSF
jgi:hypothetical protein